MRFYRTKIALENKLTNEDIWVPIQLDLDKVELFYPAVNDDNTYEGTKVWTGSGALTIVDKFQDFEKLVIK